MMTGLKCIIYSTTEEMCCVCANRVPVITLLSVKVTEREMNTTNWVLQCGLTGSGDQQRRRGDACCSGSNWQRHQITLISGNKHFTHREKCDSTVKMSLGGERLTFTAHFGSNKKLLKLGHQYWRTGTHLEAVWVYQLLPSWDRRDWLVFFICLALLSSLSWFWIITLKCRL